MARKSKKSVAPVGTVPAIGKRGSAAASANWGKVFPLVSREGGATVLAIVEATGLADKAVRNAIDAARRTYTYDALPRVAKAFVWRGAK